MRTTPALLALLLALAAAPQVPAPAPVSAAAAASPHPVPPVAPRREHLSVWHGEQVQDPWFWLRQKDDPAVRAYLEAENAYTAATTAPLQPFAEALYREMLGRIQQTDLSVPARFGRFYYYSRTVEGQQYPIRCRKPAGKDMALDPAAPEEVLLDQNQLGEGKAFLSVDAFEVSDDARQLAFTTDEVGFRQYRLFAKDLGSGVVRGPLAERVTSVAWAADSATLLYVTEDPVTKRSDTLWRLPPGGDPVRVYREEDELSRSLPPTPGRFACYAPTGRPGRSARCCLASGGTSTRSTTGPVGSTSAPTRMPGTSASSAPRPALPRRGAGSRS